MLVKGSAAQLEQIDPNLLAGVRKNEYGFEALCKTRRLPALAGLVTEQPTIEDITVVLLPEKRGRQKMTKNESKNRFIGLMRKDWALMAKQLRLLAIYLVLMMIVFSFTMDGTAALNSMFSVLMFHDGDQLLCL